MSSATSYSVHSVFKLSQEYKNQAYLSSSKIVTEDDLKQYYTLISGSIKCLQHLKSNASMTVEEDVKITFELSNLLLNETHNMELAENYLSSLKERLKNHEVGLINEKLLCNYMLYYVLPEKWGTEYHFKIALRGCDALIEDLENLNNSDEIMIGWLPIFKYVSVWLNIQLRRHHLIPKKFAELLGMPYKGSEGAALHWKAFILLRFATYSINQRNILSDQLKSDLSNLDWVSVDPKLRAWKLLVDLLIKINHDNNVTDNLREFKHFFEKERANLIEDQSCVINFENGVQFKINMPLTFSYKELKNVLLLLQSVSYLVNCYDKKANFSTKFLPKIENTVRTFIETIIDTSSASHSLSHWESLMECYESILYICDFYKSWEILILQNHIPSIENVVLNSQLQPLTQSYQTLSNAIRQQLAANSKNSLNTYKSIIETPGTPVEIKMISLLNTYCIQVGTDQSVAHTNANSIWGQIIGLHDKSELKENPIWHSSITILWVTTHFEPFTLHPFPCTDEERAAQLNELKQYYEANKFVGANIENEDKKLKKSLLLRVLLNYLGARLFEHDLEVICKISELSFQLCKQQQMLNIRYLMGLWHLMNCTTAMKSKEVTITKAKLDVIANDIMKRRNE